MASALLLLGSCSSVPVTGRRQLNIVSDNEVLSSSLTEYQSYMKTAKKSTNATETAQVERVGKRIAAATEAYLKKPWRRKRDKKLFMGVQSRAKQ